MQVEPMEPKLKLPGAERLKLKYDKLLSISITFRFQFQLAPLYLGGGGDGGSVISCLQNVAVHHARAAAADLHFGPHVAASSMLPGAKPPIL